MKKIIPYGLLFTLAFVSSVAKAENQKAHVHGLATLTLAQEKDTLEIQFESPAESLLGFEHKARTAEEKQALKETRAVLKQANTLFSFPGAACKAIEVSVNMPEVTNDEHDKHHEHEHEHHNHDKEHDDTHSEISVHYRFNCKQAQRLHSVSIALFKAFPRIEKMNAMWVTDTRQGSVLLQPNKNIISLRE